MARRGTAELRSPGRRPSWAAPEDGFFLEMEAAAKSLSVVGGQVGADIRCLVKGLRRAHDPSWQGRTEGAPCAVPIPANDSGPA